MISNIWIALFLISGVMYFLSSALKRFFTKKDDDTIDDITGDGLVPVEDDFPEDIIQVPGHSFLYYNRVTLDVYGVIIEDDIESLVEFTSNNRLCKYIQGKIVEVADGRVVAIVHSATLPY